MRRQPAVCAEIVNGKIPLYNGQAQDQLGPEERQAHPEKLPPVLEDPQPSPDPQPPMFQNCVTVVNVNLCLNNLKIATTGFGCKCVGYSYEVS